MSEPGFHGSVVSLSCLRCRNLSTEAQLMQLNLNIALAEADATPGPNELADTSQGPSIRWKTRSHSPHLQPPSNGFPFSFGQSRGSTRPPSAPQSMVPAAAAEQLFRPAAHRSRTDAKLPGDVSLDAAWSTQQPRCGKPTLLKLFGR